MLHRYISQFLEYCRLVDFSIRSIQALTARLNEFGTFLKSNKIRSVKRVSYRHLIEFAADYNSPSIQTTKSRVWISRQSNRFLTPHRNAPEYTVSGLRKFISIVRTHCPLTWSTFHQPLFFVKCDIFLSIIFTIQGLTPAWHL